MKDQILQLLRSEEGYLSGQEMSTRLGISRAAVWKAVEALRKEGYAIDSAPNRGYRLAAPTDRLSAREITARLSGHPWAGLVQVLDTVDSTNNLAKALAVQGAPAGTVLVADCQTGGRGRLGRSFSSPPGLGVYLSVILRPEAPPPALMHLTCAVAEVLCDGVEAASGLRPGIKWTNDLVSGGRKLAGILTELSLEAESGHVQYAVVGAGVNCGQRLEDFLPELQEKAVSLTMLTGKPVDRNTVADDPKLELPGRRAGGEPGYVDGPVSPGLRDHWPGGQRESGRREPVGPGGGSGRLGRAPGGFWTGTAGRAIRRGQHPGHVRLCLICR